VVEGAPVMTMVHHRWWWWWWWPCMAREPHTYLDLKALDPASERLLCVASAIHHSVSAPGDNGW
jgi:hypothetical protein